MSESSLPLVTVIVPCYNHEKYVETCLDSIFRQTYKNIEVIVVDDCSSDNSVEVIKKLQQKYDFKFIEHTENWGLTKTLNDAIYNHANGKYIKCIASDDYLTDDCVEVLVSKLEELGDECAMVYGLTKTFCIDQNSHYIFGKKMGAKFSSFHSLYYKNVIVAPSVLFCRDKFLSVGGFDESLFIEDYYLWLIFASQFRIGFVDKVVTNYFVSNNSNMTSQEDKMLSSLLQILSKIYIQNRSVLTFNDYLSSTQKTLGAYYFRNVELYLKKNKIIAIKIALSNFSTINIYNKLSDNPWWVLKTIAKIFIPLRK